MASFQPQVNLTGLGMTLQRVEDIPISDAQDNKFMPFYLEEISPGKSLYKEIVTDFENADMKVIKIRSLRNTMKLNAYRAHSNILYAERSKIDPNFRLNEKYLYHGTAADLKDICEVGLDDKLSGNGCFGKGIYFSDNPRKCAKYANRVDGDEGLILCARVILGDVKVYPKGKSERNLLREPQKVTSMPGWRFYDSVQGRPTDFQEFVVYRGTNVLVEYLITYSKSSVKERRHLQSKIEPASPITLEMLDCQCDLSLRTSRVASDLSRINKMSLEEDTTVFPTRLILTPPKAKSFVNLDADTSSSYADENKKKDHYDGSDTSSDEDQEERTTNTSSSYADENKKKDHYDGSDTSSDEDQEERTTIEDNDTDCFESDSDTEGNDMNYQIKAGTTLFEDPGIAEDKDMLLARKKIMFSNSTGEFSEYLIETFLQTSDFDVAKAVSMYHSKKKKDAENEIKYQKEIEAGEDDCKEDEAVGGDIEPLFVQGKTVPDCNSPQWSLMTETDKEAVMKVLVDNFLSITSLPDTHEPLARKVLRLTNYDLDEAIVVYYESI